MNKWDDLVKLLTRITISFIVLITCVILIFGNYPDEYTKWSFGIIGVIIGYWLK
jgi:general stress protein CsbA